MQQPKSIMGSLGLCIPDKQINVKLDVSQSNIINKDCANNWTWNVLHSFSVDGQYHSICKVHWQINLNVQTIYENAELTELLYSILMLV